MTRIEFQVISSTYSSTHPIIYIVIWRNRMESPLYYYNLYIQITRIEFQVNRLCQFFSVYHKL